MPQYLGIQAVALKPFSVEDRVQREPDLIMPNIFALRQKLQQQLRGAGSGFW